MKRTDGGFTLIELMVAVTLLAILLVGVAKLNFDLARRFYKMSEGPARGGIIAQQINQFAATPYDSLPAKAGTTTVSSGPLPYTRTVTVDSLAVNLRRVTIIITPVNTVFKADTEVMQRYKPAANPFCQTCP
jgi:prepilin-type N-terminal cleavage/methylation domain-containing protein